MLARVISTIWSSQPLRSAIPETKGRSLEDMDIIFGAISAEERQAHIAKQEHG